MTILIVDDHPIYVEGLKNLLLSWGYADLSVAQNAAEAIALSRELRPDVILMDISLPGLDGIAATAQIKRERPEARVIMLTSLGDEESLLRAVKAGASGYLIKTLSGEDLVRCLREIEEGKNPFSSGLEEVLLDELRARELRAESPPDRLLTDRQRKVLHYLGSGLSYKEIGTEMFISERTVKYHVEQIKTVLGLHSRDQLIDYAREHRP